VVSQFNNSSFIPIYPNTLPTVPKSSRASRTASLVFRNLPASQTAITRLLNRCSKSRADSAVDIISSKLMAPTIEIRGDR
jgi:hypothetical protein